MRVTNKTREYPLLDERQQNYGNAANQSLGEALILLSF